VVDAKLCMIHLQWKGLTDIKKLTSGNVVDWWVDFKFGTSVGSEPRGSHGTRMGMCLHAHVQVVAAGSSP
jgi:hypothetical protein